MLIKSENQLVRQQLEFIAKTVIDNGGIIHPDLCIKHNAERLSISCSGNADGGILLMIPDELFIPVTHLQWLGENGALSYTGSTSTLSPAQKALLDAMLQLYNLTDKLNNVAELMPAQQLPEDPELFAWLMDARPAFELPKTNPARQFIQTRLNDKNIQPESGEPTGYLMPLIDMLNHHPYGPKYGRTESGDWCIPVQHPVEGSNECFVRYNKADSLSIAMWHSYYDPFTRHVASVDCILQNELLGEIHIKGTNASRSNINAPRLLPGKGALTLQDLVLEKDQLLALRTLLGLAVRSKRRELEQPEAEVFADELIALLIDANIRKYSELQTLCNTDTAQLPLRSLFGRVAEHQLNLLEDLRAA